MLGKILGSIKKGIQKTRETRTGKIKGVLASIRRIDESLIKEIEEILITADVGVTATERICGKLRNKMKMAELKTNDDVMFWIKDEIKTILNKRPPDDSSHSGKPYVVLFVGVNGTGKTTSIAKLASALRKSEKSVLLCAADTFRAAAVQQLSIWAERIGVDIVKGQTGADPSSVVYDACSSAVARNIEYLIIDTAGRLQTKENLMNELNKIVRVIKKVIPHGPNEVLLVLDATSGQNALSQAKLFKEACNVSGIFLAKLDGSAKGGIVIAIAQEFGIPVKYVGTGETVDDISEFSADTFVEALFE